jgi:AcrR family transcriptional regulator
MPRNRIARQSKSGSPVAATGAGGRRQAAPTEPRALAKPGAAKGTTAREAVRDQARDVYRSAILEAAARVFARAGFVECKVVDIAREAGLAAGTLYNYFESKEHIFQTLCQKRGDEALVTARRLAAGEPDPLRRLEAHVEWILTHIEENAATFHVYVQLGATAEWQMRQIGGEGAHDNYRAHLALLEEAVREAQAGKRLRKDATARELTTLLAGTINAFIYEWIAAPNPRPPLGAAKARILTLFLQGASPR